MVKKALLEREKEKLRKHIEKYQEEKVRTSNQPRQRRIKRHRSDGTDPEEIQIKRPRMGRNVVSYIDNLQKYGKNIYCPSSKKRMGLRPIYIDGSNVAYSHGQGEVFSVKGIQICIDYFLGRGHEVKAFVPHFRMRKGESTDQNHLQKLVDEGLVITTPTLYIEDQQRSPYDDWYIVQAAAANGGIIVSRDNFRDIVRWNPNLRRVVEQRRLVPTFVDDMLIFPVDPHGNRKNDLEKLLKYTVKSKNIK